MNALPLRAVDPVADERIYVTQPHLAPLAEFLPYLEQIWDSKVLTNGGPFHQQLEKALCEYLGVEHLALFTNGTLALVTALQALRISGEVITTPIPSSPPRTRCSGTASSRCSSTSTRIR